jgi:hypothetical protein
MNQKESIAKFEITLERVSDYIASLDDTQYDAPIGTWSARGILAHFVGWNGYIARGCQEVQQGLEPFYEKIAGENCCDVNADFVEQFAATPRDELLSELRASGKRLMDYIATVPAENYTKDFGVRYEGEVVTISSMLDETTEDYEHHEKQIQEVVNA